jgi:phosphoglycolate phosphatase
MFKLDMQLGMQTIAAAYGYCGIESPANQWGATHLVNNPEEIMDILFPEKRIK